MPSRWPRRPPRSFSQRPRPPTSLKNKWLPACAPRCKKRCGQSAPFLAFATNNEALSWLQAMSARLERRIPDRATREDFLVTVHYEAKRAGLDPQLVLGLIQVESAFRKYAISSAGARGYMQIMPFWMRTIGTSETNLFHLRTNLRFGCVILRHYLDIERGDLFRALGRYNGSLGRAEYPNLVLAAWKQWEYNPQPPGVVRTSHEAAPR